MAKAKTSKVQKVTICLTGNTIAINVLDRRRNKAGWWKPEKSGKSIVFTSDLVGTVPVQGAIHKKVNIPSGSLQEKLAAVVLQALALSEEFE